MRTQGAARGGGGATAPTADAGSNQAVEGRPTVTLDGSGSTGGGATYAWSLRDPAGMNVSSLLSSQTAQSPTFTPKTAPVGNYSATLAVTKGGLTSVSNTNVQVGAYAGTWLRLVPGQHASSYTSGNYTTHSITDDGTWTTATLSPKLASVVNLTDTEIRWFDTSVASCLSVQSIEFRIQFRPDVSQPISSDQCFAGLILGASTDPTNTSIVGTAFRSATGTPVTDTRISCRQGGSSFGWGNSASGFDTAYGLVRMRMGRGRSVQFIVGKYDSASGTGSNSGTTVYSHNRLWDNNPLKAGLFIGRAGASSGDLTMQFTVHMRVNLKEGV